MGRIRPERLAIAGAAVGVLRLGAPERPAIVLLHGYSGDLLTWQFQLAALARDHHVVALDLPGHGCSGSQRIGYWRDMVPWLAEVLAALELERPHLVGHSLGARVALGLAEAQPALPRSLSLIACAGLSPSYDYPLLQRLASIASLADALTCARRLLGAESPELDRFARGLFAKLSPPEVQAGLRAYLEHNFADGKLLPERPVAWSRLACPIQLIWGTADEVVALPPRRWLPGHAPVHLLEGVGHLPHVAAAGQVTALLAGFCRASEAAQPQTSRVAAQE